jgi:hypothetical protein
MPPPPVTDARNADAASARIACTDPSHALVLEAARSGDVPFLRGVLLSSPSSSSSSGVGLLRSAVCESGCGAVHWAAGSDQVEALRFLLDPPVASGGAGGEEEADLRGGGADCDDDESKKDQEPSLPLRRWSPRSSPIPAPPPIFKADAPAAGRSAGRTAAHYAARNGCAQALALLVERYGADPDARSAKGGVSPFQLAVWRNQLEVAKLLVEKYGVDPRQTNDFGCNAAHWACISPPVVDDEDGETGGSRGGGAHLLPLLRWLKRTCGASLFRAEQRQGHNALHKACWMGHSQVVEWLHDECGMWDDRPDRAGNFGVDLCRMADTPRHRRLERYLRERCGRQAGEWCRILGLDPEGIRPMLLLGSSTEEISKVLRRAYLARVRQVHPDLRKRQMPSSRLSAGSGGGAGAVADDGGGAAIEAFQRVQDAYRGLVEGGLGTQGNPNHRLPPLLRDRPEHVSGGSGGEEGTPDEKSPPGTQQSSATAHPDRFKARLLVVLNEYGDKGMNASNLKKKWKQVWNEPFPSEIGDEYALSGAEKDRSGGLVRYVSRRAGDVVSVYRSPKTGEVVVRARKQQQHQPPGAEPAPR